MKLMLLGNHGPFAFGFALRAAVWTPAQLPQVQAWWDASDQSTVTLNADRVAAIADKSLNAYTLTQPTAADQPIYDTSGTVASLPMLQQNSIDSLNSTTTSLIRNTGDAYVFTVGYYPTTANSTANYMLVFVSSGTSSSSTRLGLTAYPTNGSNALSVAGRRLDSDAYDVVPSSTTRASIQNTLFLETGRRHYAQNKTYHWTNGNLDLNGVPFSTQTAGNTSDTNPLFVSLLAPNATLSTLPDTRVGEVIICNQTLTEDDRQRVEGYLAWKWGGDALWTPAQLTNLAMWLDAEDTSTLVFNGSTVSQWNDKSGNGNHVSNATASTQPTYLATGYNGKPTLSFTSTNLEYLFKSGVVNFSAQNDLTIAAVFEFFQTSQRWDMIAGWRSAPNSSGGGSGVPILQGMNQDAQIGYHNTDVADIRIKVDVTSRLGKKIATIGRSGGTIGNGGSATVTCTGFSQATYITIDTQTWDSDNPTGFQIGGKQQIATDYSDKYISEVVCCNTQLSTTDRQKLEGYLAHKWGLVAELPALHPYKYQAPRL